MEEMLTDVLVFITIAMFQQDVAQEGTQWFLSQIQKQKTISLALRTNKIITRDCYNNLWYYIEVT